MAVFIAYQRTSHAVPHAVTCRALGVSESWFYKWHDRPPTPRQLRRAVLDEAVAAAFKDSRELHRSPRIHADLRDDGWQVSEKTVADSMNRQGLVARAKKRRKNTTRPDKNARPFPDLVNRDFTAEAPNCTWVGEMTEIPTDEGRSYLSTAIDLFSRRLLGYATSPHPDAELAGQTIKMAVAVRGGDVAGVIFHTDRGSTGAHAPALRSVREALAAAYRLKSAGPAGREALFAAEREARQRIGALTGAGEADVAFVGDVSTVWNSIASSWVWEPGDNVVLNSFEHPSVYLP